MRRVNRRSGGLGAEREVGEKKGKGYQRTRQAKEWYGPEKSGGVRIWQKQRAKSKERKVDGVKAYGSNIKWMLLMMMLW